LLSDAISSIRSANEEALQRRDAQRLRRRPIQLLDNWLSQVETLMERDDPVVPEPLIDEIAGFIVKLNPRLHRRLRRNGGQDASRVLNVLFDAEEQFLPKAPTGVA
jgi:hypothetical protein